VYVGYGGSTDADRCNGWVHGALRGSERLGNVRRQGNGRASRKSSFGSFHKGLRPASTRCFALAGPSRSPITARGIEWARPRRDILGAYLTYLQDSAVRLSEEMLERGGSGVQVQVRVERGRLGGATRDLLRDHDVYAPRLRASLLIIQSSP
jgi:hypothetical protein